MNHELNFSLNSLFGMDKDSVDNQNIMKECIHLSLDYVAFLRVLAGTINAGLTQEIGGILTDHPWKPPWEEHCSDSNEPKKKVNKADVEF